MSLGDSDTAVNSSDRVTVQEETLYTYGDAEWGDLLTAYDGEEITYDGIGNPLSYRGWTMSWQGGRQLASMTKGSDTLSFAYNESGLRTSKTVNGVAHSYVWQGSKLAADITDTYALYFHYDSPGDVIGFTRTANGTDTEYFYVKNLQGDILKVITATGTEAATYTYDAWGKLLTATGDLADINPLRYRGYFYDTETSLYYLKSRYYDPEVGRFINPDAYASTGQGILGANMFTYCNNSPVILSDVTGSLSGLASKILGIAAGVVCGIAAAAVVAAVAPAAICALSVGLASWGVSSAAAATIAEVAIFVVGANAAVYGADSGYSAVTGESPMLEAFGGNEDVYETWQIASATSIYGVGAVGLYGIRSTSWNLDSFSTGRTAARSLNENLAMQAAKSMPRSGKIIMTKLNDLRLPAGVYKYQQVFYTSSGKIVIHYLGDPTKNIFFDFKFVNS